jgi:membrane protein involved in colicin uptake
MSNFVAAQYSDVLEDRVVSNRCKEGMHIGKRALVTKDVGNILGAQQEAKKLKAEKQAAKAAKVKTDEEAKKLKAEEWAAAKVMAEVRFAAKAVAKEKEENEGNRKAEVSEAHAARRGAPSGQGDAGGKVGGEGGAKEKQEVLGRGEPQSGGEARAARRGAPTCGGSEGGMA